MRHLGGILTMAVMVACLFLVSGTAQAAPYVDVIKYSQYMTIGSTHTFTFNLNNDTLKTGDLGVEDVINTSLLGLNFRDDEKDTWYNPWSHEVAGVLADDRLYITEVQTGHWTANVLGQIKSDHTLTVTVESLWGDFYLGDASISGDYTDIPAVDSTSPVPEPATCSLLGMGLVGLLGKRLRRIRS
jgi:hypothetical protein